MKNKSYKKFKKIESNTFINNYLDDFSTSNEEIKKYYKINNFAYKLFHSSRGFMHFRISNKKWPKLGDIYYQPNKVSKYIKGNNTVLELGCGTGANLLYLAKKHKDSKFIGVDLSQIKFNKTKYSNVDFYCQDFTNLSCIADNTIDVVYGIETIVHSSNKEKVFSEVFRILKKDGIFIVYDYALSKEYDEYLPYIQKGMEIVSKCGVSPIIESEKSWNNYFKDNNFKEITITDFSKNILFDLKRLLVLATMIMWNKILVRISFSILPKLFCGNILLGWMAYDAFNENIVKYNEWIFKK